MNLKKLIGFKKIVCLAFSFLSISAEATNPFLEKFMIARPNIKKAYDSYEEVEIRVSHDDSLFDEYVRLEKEWNDLYLPLVNEYAWGIPSDEAISLIAKYSPIVEMSAGKGYWAHLLQEAGAQVTAYDNFSWNSSHGNTWTTVIKQEASDTKIASDHTLFLCWPSMQNGDGPAALSNYSGNTVIYVGELPNTGTQRTYCPELGFEIAPRSLPRQGGSKFHQMLKNDFEIVEQLELPNWPGYHDRLYVFQRKSKTSGY